MCLDDLKLVEPLPKTATSTELWESWSQISANHWGPVFLSDYSAAFKMSARELQVNAGSGVLLEKQIPSGTSNLGPEKTNPPRKVKDLVQVTARSSFYCCAFASAGQWPAPYWFTGWYRREKRQMKQFKSDFEQTCLLCCCRALIRILCKRRFSSGMLWKVKKIKEDVQMLLQLQFKSTRIFYLYLQISHEQGH